LRSPTQEPNEFAEVDGLVSTDLRCCMRACNFILGLIVSLTPMAAIAGSTQWRQFAIPSTGVKVDIPVSIFTEDAGAPEGAAGRRFFTSDRRANLTVQSVFNPENDSPAAFLAKQRPPAGIQYKRVTPRFFAVSSIRDGRTWYNRCNGRTDT
jgi:hypothetical protein